MKEQAPIAVRLSGLRRLLDNCGRVTAERIGKEAGARFVVGSAVLYDVEKIRQYMKEATENDQTHSTDDGAQT